MCLYDLVIFPRDIETNVLIFYTSLWFWDTIQAKYAISVALTAGQMKCACVFTLRCPKCFILTFVSMHLRLLSLFCIKSSTCIICKTKSFLLFVGCISNSVFYSCGCVTSQTLIVSWSCFRRCQRSYLQLHHGVLTQLVSTRCHHIINADQLGLVTDAISPEALNQCLLAAILTCGRMKGDADSDSIMQSWSSWVLCSWLYQLLLSTTSEQFHIVWISISYKNVFKITVELIYWILF